MSGHHLRSMTFGILGEVGCRPVAEAGSSSNHGPFTTHQMELPLHFFGDVRALHTSPKPSTPGQTWSLPIWLPDLTVHDLRVGKHKLDIRFWREREQTSFEVTRGDPKLIERYE